MTNPLEKVGAGETEVSRRGALSKRYWWVIAVLIAVIGVMTIAGLWAAYSRIGRTPGELMDYAERRQQGHPRIEAIALPVIAKLRERLHAPSAGERRKQPFIVPAPPPLARMNNGKLTRAPTMEAADQILKVGPMESIRSIAQAERLARDGDIVEVQAGEYHGDVATWHQKKLTLSAGDWQLN